MVLNGLDHLTDAAPWLKGRRLGLITSTSGVTPVSYTHLDSDIRGRGLDLATVKRDYELMKWIGANCFRTSHYPYAEELYQMADEEGFLIIDEVPAVGFMQSTMNFLAANQGNGKKVGYFEKKTTPKLLENHKVALTDMITRDKNHASVIAWSCLLYTSRCV